MTLNHYSSGDSVEIHDHSEAHGDTGKVLWVQEDGLVVVELDDGCVWPASAGDLKSRAP